jgi:hypothetical protein
MCDVNAMVVIHQNTKKTKKNIYRVFHNILRDYKHL